MNNIFFGSNYLHIGIYIFSIVLSYNVRKNYNIKLHYNILKNALRDFYTEAL